METGFIEIVGTGACGTTLTQNIPLTGPLTITTDGNGNPVLQNVIDAFNSIGGSFTMIGDGPDDVGTNQVYCFTVPTGVGDISVSIKFANSPQFWTTTWDDDIASFSVLDDNNNVLTGSAAEC